MTSAENKSRRETAPIFNTTRILTLEQRAQRRRARQSQPHFILTRIAQDCADNLLMIKRQFSKALIIAPDGFEALFMDQISKEKCPQNLIFTNIDTLSETLKTQESFDLIISILWHHHDNNPLGYLRVMHSLLIEDGYFLSAVLGGETLTSLRDCLYKADQHHFGGIYPRIHPMINLKQAVDLLKATGFNLNVGDRDNLVVNYKSLKTLINDLRDLGETYALSLQNSPAMTRSYWQWVEKNYPTYTEQSNYKACFDIIWSSGWIPHESQQKPLKPGEAKMSFANYFKSLNV